MPDLAYEKLTQYERRSIYDATFVSPTIILDITSEDDTLQELLEEYENQREALSSAAAAIAEYLEITEDTDV